MSDAASSLPSATPAPWVEEAHTAVLVLADGTVLHGRGFGAVGEAAGEVCFNTAMTGYQEILTDPSYAGQIITFTFPHIGNVGANDEDVEIASPAAASGVRGMVLRAPITGPSNYRAQRRLDAWAEARGIIGLAGIDTRALTARIRQHGMPNAVIAYDPAGRFDLDRLAQDAAVWPGIEGAELARDVTTAQTHHWDQTPWAWNNGYGTQDANDRHVVVIDFGTKANILRELAGLGCRVTVVTATSSAEDVLSHRPDGVVLSNGPGDPAATGEYALPTIRALIDHGMPILGICLGHQILGLAVGGQTRKMPQGHHGANHPVLDLATGRVEISSMNHGFTVDAGSLPDGVEESHRSLFDGTNCGLMMADKPVSSVQHHPEASPGPQDSHPVFQRFVELIDSHHAKA